MGIALNIDTALAMEVARLMDAIAIEVVKHAPGIQMDSGLREEIEQIANTRESFSAVNHAPVTGAFSEARFMSFEELLEEDLLEQSLPA